MNETNELAIITRQEPGIAKFENFEEIKEFLDDRLSAYRNVVYTEDGLDAAKKDKARLNRLKKDLEDRRREIKKIYMAPYANIEAQINELIEMIKVPVANIDSFVKGMEAEEKSKKLQVIRGWYDGMSSSLGDLAERVFDAPGFFDEKWLNKSCKAAVWQDELRSKIAKTASDISAIQDASGSHSAAVLTKYLDGLDMDAATAFKRDLEATARVADAEITTDSEDDRVIGYKVLKISGTQRQMERLFQQLELMGMDFDELEDGMPQPMRELKNPDFDSFVAFDIETSGTFGAENGDVPAEITEIGAVRVVNGKVEERKDWLCNPGRKIVPQIARLTKITDSMVADAPPVDEVIKEFAVFVSDLPLVGHNIKASDLHYITRALKRAGIAMDNAFFDTYVYAKTLKDQYGWENVKLETLSQYFGIEQDSAHRAYCDAEANAGVYFKLKELG